MQSLTGCCAGGNGASNDRNLTNEEMLEIFKQTSFFNVKSALSNNQVLRDARPSGLRTGVDHDFEDAWDDLKDEISDTDAPSAQVSLRSVRLLMFLHLHTHIYIRMSTARAKNVTRR